MEVGMGIVSIGSTSFLKNKGHCKPMAYGRKKDGEKMKISLEK